MDVLKLSAVGDISLILKGDRNPFKNIAPIVNGSDIIFGNLEAPLARSGNQKKRAVCMQSSPEKSFYLKEAGFNVLNIANNHIMDMGPEGLKTTINTLRTDGIVPLGATYDGSNPNPIMLERNGIKVALLAYGQKQLNKRNGVQLSGSRRERILKDIREVKARCDHVVVSMHWGTENAHYPSPKQIHLAHTMIDQGASLIIGHHPHVVQGIEEYHEGLIAYSLGNFQFDPNMSKSESDHSMILSVQLLKNKIGKWTATPIIIDKDWAPRLVNENERIQIANFIIEISRKIQEGEITEKWWYETVGGKYIQDNLDSYRIRIRKHGLVPLVECVVWFLTPFFIKCYLGVVRNRFRAWRE